MPAAEFLLLHMSRTLWDPVDPRRLVLAGRGLGGIVAIMVAALVPEVRGTLCLETPESLEAVVRTARVTESLEIFMPGFLAQADVGELASAIGDVRFIRPRRADGRAGVPGTDAEAAAWMWERLGI